MADKLNITREAVETGNYTCENGVIVLVAPHGTSTIQHLQDIASGIPKRELSYADIGVASLPQST